jgi:hypothetical protein
MRKIRFFAQIFNRYNPVRVMRAEGLAFCSSPSALLRSFFCSKGLKMAEEIFSTSYVMGVVNHGIFFLLWFVNIVYMEKKNRGFSVNNFDKHFQASRSSSF